MILLKHLTLVTGFLAFLICCARSTDIENQGEVFVFLLECNSSVWMGMDWTKITTVALAGWVDPDLVDHAHRHQAKVVYIPANYTDDMTDSEQRRLWIKEQIQYSTRHNLDGINFDFENEVLENSPMSLGYLNLVKECSAAFKKINGNFQISIDYGWSPGADRRMYRYKEMAKYVDVVFIMAYDTQSQIFGRECTAKPNSPLMKIYRGVQKYLQIGIPKKKMVLGVPWYGYKYPCTSLIGQTCFIKKVPFRGVNCSDAAGKEFAYKDIVEMQNRSLHGIHWDINSQTPYFELKEEGTYYQIWFDNPTSLFIKYQISQSLGLLGVGFWTGNYLDYSNSTMVQDMWSVVPQIKSNKINL